jgi:hypothetical protein
MLEDLLDSYIRAKGLSFEGTTGVRNLETIAKTLGYNESGFRYGTPIESFLSDNPGAIEAIVEWIGKQNVPEWQITLEEEVAPEEEEEEED